LFWFLKKTGKPTLKSGNPKIQNSADFHFNHDFAKGFLKAANEDFELNNNSV
jgi:hypothetical protein